MVTKKQQTKKEQSATKKASINRKANAETKHATDEQTSVINSGDSSEEENDEDINMADDVEENEESDDAQEQNSGDSSEEEEEDEEEDVNSLNESDLDEADDDMESEEEEDDDDDLEEMDIDGSSKKRAKKYDSEAFSEAMTKILSHKLSGSDKKQPILARSKGVERKIEDEKLDYKARKILAAQKKAAKEKGRVIPDFTTFEYEKRLRKVATRGVVKLFNAIRTQQKMTEVAVSNAASTRKTLNSIEKAKDVSTMSKSSFLDLLKSGKN